MDMDVRVLHLIEGARQARGLTVVIDVFRAFSVACYLAAGGAREILPVGEAAAARALKAEHPGYLLVGEVGGQRPPGFDHGNSPSEIEGRDFTGRTIVQRTSAGTQGLVSATQAAEVITGSFVNAPAVIEYIRLRAPRELSLVCMGHAATAPAEEDTLCAEFIRDSLAGRPPDFARIRAALRDSLSASRFFDPEKTWAPERDFDLCLALGRFGFVLRLERLSGGRLVLRPVNVLAGRGPARRIVGFHRDAEGHWVADLECGHTQHVRHDPPWQTRPWVLTEEGRRGFLGAELRCAGCAGSQTQPQESTRGTEG
jgi:2-phosphosulfolactate phosphatase